MAEDVIRAGGALGADPAPPSIERTPSRAERARSSAYRARFVFVYFVLAVVLGAAVGALILALGHSSSSKPTAHAAPIQPTTTGELGAMELAARVQGLYRGSDGLPFVDVIANRNSLQDGSGGFLRVTYQILQPSDTSQNRDSAIERVNDSIHFSLCGTGQGCAIPGTATAKRGVLLRREGLELALRTFQTDRSVDNVVVFLRPIPAPSDGEGYALMFDRATVARINPSFLSQPISTTLPGAGSPITAADISSRNEKLVQQMTKPYLFVYRYQVVGGHDAALDLTPTQG